MVKLYHYTDKQGYDSIRRSRMIRKSDGPGDAVYGPGVYLTSFSPQNRTKLDIAKNNYDGMVETYKGEMEALKKVAYWFEFDLPNRIVEKVPDKRDVWLHPDDDLDFDDYSPTDKGDFSSFTGGNRKTTRNEMDALLGYLEQSGSYRLPRGVLQSS